ncbi:SagB family peptide dehydrogenase [Streptomyces sp. NPDC096205]|uniref:SagB family peptide dehydrogenase n=1 Tax=Streptomyces sp. NPDC096205 TaxID=3366081 RepID=UPI00380D0F91
MTSSTSSAALEYLDSGHQPPDALPAADPLRLPPVYKRYPSAPRRPLPDRPDPRDADPLRRLSWLLHRAGGLTRMRWMSGIMPLGLGGSAARRRLLSPGRTAAASGSRYPVEFYLAHPALDGLPAGLSHYDPVHHALEHLRADDGRHLVMPLLAEPPAREPEFVLLLGSVLWRNMAKYGVFGYRLQSLDVGVAAAQAVAAAEAAGLTASVHLRYEDAALDELLGLSSFAESVFAVITLHRPDASAAEPATGHYAELPVVGPGLVPDSEVPVAEPDPVLVTEVPAAGPDPVLVTEVPVAGPDSVLVTEVPVAEPDPVRVSGLSVVGPGLVPVSEVPVAEPDPVRVTGPSVAEAGPVPVTELPVAVPAAVPITEVPALAEAAALHAAIRRAAPGDFGDRPAPWPLPDGPRHALPAAALDLVDGFPGRRTAYGFRPAPVAERTLAALLAAAGTPMTGAEVPVRLAGLLQRVPEVETGAYVYDAEAHALIGTRRADAASDVLAAAKSPMLADECRTATAVLAVCGDPRNGVERCGDRWYRAQNIAAGATAQRIALAAAAAGLESHVHCDFDPEGVRSALGLTTGPLQPLVLVTVGPRAPDRTDPHLPLRAGF